MFEGEGTIYIPPRTEGRGIRIAIAQSDDDREPPLLVRMQRVVGCGTITKLRANKVSVIQRWQWRVQRRVDVEWFLRSIAPYLTPGSPAQEKIGFAFAAIETDDPQATYRQLCEARWGRGMRARGRPITSPKRRAAVVS